MKALKPFVFLLCLVPFFLLIWAAFNDSLGANPLDAIRDTTGRWTLRFLFITLSISPLRQLSGWNGAIRFRRMLGLFAFFYGFLHFITYLWFSVFFDFNEMAIDIAKRPYITVGLLAFVLMIPLAITSTKKWIVRLGGKRWQLLHRAIYISAVAGVIHYFALVKIDTRYPFIYAAILLILLGFRVWHATRPKLALGRKVEDSVN